MHRRLSVSGFTHFTHALHRHETHGASIRSITRPRLSCYWVVVAQHGTVGQPEADALCVRAIDCFLETLGMEAGNIGLRFMARGGVYIAGGGLASLLLDRIKDGRWASWPSARGIFHDKNRAVTEKPLRFC
jgi:glucokinase|eukprot:COSAG01_NODE_6829_length_3482_cov_1.330772_2_plen_131_part_00